MLFYFIDFDEEYFIANLARYVVNRDSVDALDMSVSKGSLLYREEALDGIDNCFDELPSASNTEIAVPVLDPKNAENVDIFCRRIKPETAEQAKIALAATLIVNDSCDRTFVLKKADKDVDQSDPISIDKLEIVFDDDERIASFREVGTCCPFHPDRSLGEQIQSDVWPYKVRPSCCVETHGKRCSSSIGTLFVCGHVGKTEDGRDVSQCTYALCELHFKGSLIDTIVTPPAVSLYRMAQRRGFGWVVVTLSILLANASYTPLMRSALMILACDPYYQCYFDKCWSNGTRDFLLAAYLSIVLITVLGCGFPIAQVLRLRKRRTMLGSIFFAEEYGDRYKDPNGIAPKIDEWRRFLGSDHSALGKIYVTFKFKYMYLPPIMLVWKFLLLAPAVFIERNSFGQLLGIAIVQVLYGVFFFVTDPCLSPLVDMMFKLGAVHQLLYLGLLSLNTRQRYYGATRLDWAMIVVTATYLLIVVACVIYKYVAPVCIEKYGKTKIKKLLTNAGMTYSLFASLYVISLEPKPFVEPQHTKLSNRLYVVKAMMHVDKVEEAPETSVIKHAGRVELKVVSLNKEIHVVEDVREFSGNVDNIVPLEASGAVTTDETPK